MKKMNLALQMAGIELPEPELFVGTRLTADESTWVVYIGAANEWVFELPINLAYQKVLEIALAVIRWDEAMAAHSNSPSTSPGPDEKLISLVMWAALLMKPCELKGIIDSVHPIVVVKRK